MSFLFTGMIFLFHVGFREFDEEEHAPPGCKRVILKGACQILSVEHLRVSLIPEQLLWVDGGILHLAHPKLPKIGSANTAHRDAECNPLKCSTFSPGFSLTFAMESVCQKKSFEAPQN